MVVQKSQTYFVVDAFTDRPFTGNPAAVMILQSWPNDEWLQNVSMEMNLSETAFLVPTDDGYHLRWFTPNVEVDLCGHATLASAKVLAELGKLPSGQSVKFASRSGTLVASRDQNEFTLDFPVKPAASCEAPVGLIESLNVSPRYVGKNEFDYLIEVEDETIVRALKPNFQAMSQVPCRGVIVTSPSFDRQFDFVSRFFAPAAGVNEDPVTGSAHCCLADYWGKKLDKTNMRAKQLSIRGGIINVERNGSRVLLKGGAVLVQKGELFSTYPA